MVGNRRREPKVQPPAFGFRPESCPRTSAERSRGYRAGAVVFRQGDPADRVFKIDDGLVKLQRVQESGEVAIVGLRSKGWYLGTAAVQLEGAYFATAQAVTSSRLVAISAAEFRRRADEDREFSSLLHRMQSQELFDLVKQLTDLGTLSAYERLVRLIEGLGEGVAPNPSGDVQVRLPLKQWEVAELLSVRPPYLSELYRKFEATGRIRRARSGLVLRSVSRRTDPQVD